MPQFFTVKEAAQMTGKSTSSIRRLIYTIIKTDQHPGRLDIQPSVEEAQALRIKGDNFAWRISEELLKRAIPADSEPEKGTDRSSTRDVHDGHTELLAMLRAELDIKNGQIAQQGEMLATQMELISGLSERLREGNVLIGSLQQQLALPEVSSRPKSSVVDAKTSKPAAGQAAKVPTKSPKAAKSKRGLFARLFH